MKPSFPDISTGWKVNQVLPTSETTPTFSQASRACLSNGHSENHGAEARGLTGLPPKHTLSKESLAWQRVLGAFTVKRHSVFFNTYNGSCAEPRDLHTQSPSGKEVTHLAASAVYEAPTHPWLPQDSFPGLLFPKLCQNGKLLRQMLPPMVHSHKEK